MALTPEEEAELAELSKKDPYFRAQAERETAAPGPKGAVIDQRPTEGLGLQAVFGKDWTPYGQGGQPIEQTPMDQVRDTDANQVEAERVAGMLDPRFALVPQVLALQPATNDPEGDEAARRKYEAGQRDAVWIYEPPVAVVRKHLLENPALLRMFSPNEVPDLAEIENLSSDSDLYKTAADYMFKKADEASAKSGQRYIRYSKAPWLWSDKSAVETLKTKVFEGADPELANRAQAFVLGADDTLTLGAMRAGQEAGGQTSRLTQYRPGVNANVPQSTADVNAWTEEEYPLEYGAGQVVGMLNPRSVVNKVWDGIQKQSGWLIKALARTPTGRAVDEFMAPAVKDVLGVGSDAATGAVAAGAGQAGQELVDSAGRGELPQPAEAWERVKDVGETGGWLAGAGSAIRRGAGAGADVIRDSSRYSDRYGRGLVRQTEPNLDWGLRSVVTGPRVNKQTRTLLKESSQGGHLPGDALAEEIAGPVGKAAEQNARVAADRAKAAQATYQRSPEGATPSPVRQLQETVLEDVRSHYQPKPGGGLRAINDRPTPSQKVLNSLIEDVSVTPIQGASKLDPDEAGQFLSPRAQYKILKEDIEKVTRDRLSKPVDRSAYLANKPGKARDGINEEIEADIDDLIGFDQQGVPRTIDKRSAEYKQAEQKVLRERTDTETALEPFGGSLAEYLKQRGIDGVYITPRALDARRTDRLIDTLGADTEFGKAASRDRRQFSAGGKKGGYHEMLEAQGAEAARHARIAQNVAPGGDAFKPIAGLYQPNPGEKQLVDQVKALAEQSGVSNQLERMRGLQDTLAVTNRARARGPDGRARGAGYFSPTNIRDVAPLRAFPVLKALEGPLGPLRGSTAGRAAVLGGGETEAQQRRAESGARGKYELARERRLKEIAEEKAREAQQEQGRRGEKIQRRR